MSWEAWGAIGEMVGALGVILSLGFLAIQVRQNTIMMRANVKEQRTQSSQQLFFKADELAGIFADMNDGKAPSTEQRIRLRLLAMAQHRGLEAYVHQRNKGLYDDDEWSGVLATIQSQLQQGYFRLAFEENPESFSGSYQRLIRSLLDEPDA